CDKDYACMEEDVAESFERLMISQCLMGRAHRLQRLAESRQEYEREASQVAAKACAFFPVSINFYDFACILHAFGEIEQAKLIFGEFLRLHAAGPMNPIEEVALKQRDLNAAVMHAKGAIG